MTGSNGFPLPPSIHSLDVALLHFMIRLTQLQRHLLPSPCHETSSSSPSGEEVLVDTHGEVTRFTLNRPSALNALNLGGDCIR